MAWLEDIRRDNPCNRLFKVDNSMKKIPKSITVTVRNGDNFRATRPGITYLGEGVNLGNGSRWVCVRDHFPRTPDTPYKLTYSLNPRGNLVASIVNVFPGIKRRDSINKSGLIVCFLPHSWCKKGLRVSRTVERMKP